MQKQSTTATGDPAWKMMKIMALLVWVPAAVAAAEPEAFKFTQYTDFGHGATIVQSDDPVNEFRNTRDFTRPVHGPWLTNPSENSITVTYVARSHSAAGIEYRKKGTQDAFKRQWTRFYGATAYHKRIHAFHLKNLDPATEYEYRFLSGMNSHELSRVWCNTFTNQTLYTFKTVDPELGNYKVFFTADTHGSSRVWLEPMIARSGSKDADLFVMLGDNVDDTLASDAELFITSNFLDEACRVYASKGKAAIFLRGNHECLGIDAWKWGEFFSRPDHVGYYAFRQGPVLFVCLDTPAHHGGTELNQEIAGIYMAEQAEWIAGLKKTEMWNQSTFRVVMSHYPLNLLGGGNQAWFRPFFEEVLNDASRNGRIHAFIAGHEHVQMRRDPNSATVKVTKPHKSIPPVSDKLNFLEIAQEASGAMTMEVTPQKLVFKAHRWRDAEVTLKDHFEVNPDGKVKDLMEVESFPNPPPAER